MAAATAFNEDQRARWNGNDGEFWTREQERMDRTLAPVLGPLVDFAAPRAGSTVIDVGCGCGATTIELARAVGPSGRVFAIDISAPMLDRARERLSRFGNATCILGDAAELALGEIAAELMVSRFGVMFFGDPVAAFSNLRNGLAPGGRLRFACWRAISENPWLEVPLQAVLKHVPPLPKPEPGEPGPFAFADTPRLTRILTAAGFTAPAFTALDIEMDLGSGGGLEEAVMQSSMIGPARRALKDQPENVDAAAVESIRQALAPYASSAGVKLPGAVWLVAAGRVT